MLPSVGLLQSKNSISLRSNPQGRGHWLANHNNKTKKIKFNWRDFWYFGKGNLNWEK